MIFTIDHEVAKGVNGFLHWSNNSLTDFFRFFTSLGNYGILVVGISLVLFFIKKSRLRGFVAFSSFFFATIFTLLVLKLLINRPRPFIDTTSDFYQYWLEAGSLKASGSSFPSGHSSSTMGFAASLFLTSKHKKYSWTYFLIPLLMGFTRIYFNVHYFSDVIAGYLVGFIFAIFSYYLFTHLLKKELEKHNYIPADKNQC